jgi:hypothetical protein
MMSAMTETDFEYLIMKFTSLSLVWWDLDRNVEFGEDPPASLRRLLRKGRNLACWMTNVCRDSRSNINPGNSVLG